MDEPKFDRWWREWLASLAEWRIRSFGEQVTQCLKRGVRTPQDWALLGWMAHEESLREETPEDPEIPIATGGTMPLSKVREMLTGPETG